MIVSRIFVAPGNGGTHGLRKVSNVSIAPSDFGRLADFAKSVDANLVVPG